MDVQSLFTVIQHCNTHKSKSHPSTPRAWPRFSCKNSAHWWTREWSCRWFLQQNLQRHLQHLNNRLKQWWHVSTQHGTHQVRAGILQTTPEPTKEALRLFQHNHTRRHWSHKLPWLNLCITFPNLKKTCQRQKITGKHKYGKIPQLTSSLRNYTPWEKIIVDGAGTWVVKYNSPFEETNVITKELKLQSVVKSATNWVEFTMLPNNSSCAAAITLDKQWFCRYPWPT